MTAVPAMSGIITIHINPVAFHLGPLEVHWYGIMYAIAFTVAFLVGARPHLAARGISHRKAEDFLVITIIAGLVGARLYYDVQNGWWFYLTHPQDILAFWQGGMAFFGAIIFGLAAILILAWRNKVSFWLLGDAGAIFACIGQPIGRIGNIVNGDILGRQSTLPWATAYTYPTGYGHCAVLQTNFVCGVGYQPAAAYEALGTLVILVILLLVRRRFPDRAGILISSYVGLYSLSQILIFFLRASEPVVFLGLKQAQWSGIVGLVVATPIVFLLWKKSPERLTRIPLIQQDGSHSPEKPEPADSSA